MDRDCARELDMGMMPFGNGSPGQAVTTPADSSGTMGSALLMPWYPGTGSMHKRSMYPL